MNEHLVDDYLVGFDNLERKPNAKLYLFSREKLGVNDIIKIIKSDNRITQSDPMSRQGVELVFTSECEKFGVRCEGNRVRFPQNPRRENALADFHFRALNRNGINHWLVFQRCLVSLQSMAPEKRLLSPEFQNLSRVAYVAYINRCLPYAKSVCVLFLSVVKSYELSPEQSEQPKQPNTAPNV